jgi:hypothetical protein
MGLQEARMPRGAAKRPDDCGAAVLQREQDLRRRLDDAAKLWLAHDGLWFQAVEARHGMEAAIACDRDAWERFSPLEARRIVQRLGLPAGGGLNALERALSERLYSLINRQSSERTPAGRLIFRMESCRVQDARRLKGLAPFPCRSVGIVEYTTFAAAIDPRIETHCIHCPPDAPGAPGVCAWEFRLRDEDDGCRAI